MEEVLRLGSEMNTRSETLRFTREGLSTAIGSLIGRLRSGDGVDSGAADENVETGVREGVGVKVGGGIESGSVVCCEAEIDVEVCT